MGKIAGKYVALSPFRRLVVDLMHFSAQVPSVAADRRMNLADLAAVRRRHDPRPGWCALFAKAYAALARDVPALRQSYLKFPYPRLYEHPHSVATLNVERQAGDERVVLYCLVRSPETRSVAEIDAIVREHQDAPLASLRSYSRSLAMARVPWPLRRWLWWASLNVFGRRRCHNFGTFGVSSVGAQGAGLLHLTPLLTTTLHFGLFDADDRLDVRLSWDHRVLDGATIARCLVDLERILTHDLVRELALPSRAAA